MMAVSVLVLFVDFLVRIPGPGNPENSNAKARRRKAGKDGRGVIGCRGRFPSISHKGRAENAQVARYEWP